MGLPEGLLIGYYGDDFTGSTDVMESLTYAGLPTVLFIEPPQPEQLARFAGLRGIGVAGVTRSLPPAEMEEALEPVFARFDELAIRLRSGRIFGEALGRIVGALMERGGVQRGCVAGGDSSAYAARRMGVEALEVIGPMAPGGPLCRAHTGGTALDGAELNFKGGQVGREDFFVRLLSGRP